MRKSMGVREMREVLRLLREARRSATFKCANFDGFGPDEKRTEDIRKHTRLYRETWLIRPIDLAINHLIERLDDREIAISMENIRKEKP